MKSSIIAVIGFVFCIACSNQKEKEASSDTIVVKKDTTTVTKDTTIVETQVSVATPAPVIVEVEHTNSIMVEKGDTIYTSTRQDMFVSDPYDFYLDAHTIEELVGEKVKTEEKEFKGGDDYDAYTYTTVEFGTTSISFYSYPGKHSCRITTPLLPLKDGIKVGMKKEDFLKTFSFDDDKAPTVSIYRLYADYGYMDFTFKEGVLETVYAFYEEGS
jgi:hypothetical protein